MDEIKRILKEGLLRNNGKYILLAMTALFLFLYNQKQERITPQLLSMEVFGCKNYIVSRKEADQDPKGRQTYRIGMSCQEAEKQVWLQTLFYGSPKMKNGSKIRC